MSTSAMLDIKFNKSIMRSMEDTIKMFMKIGWRLNDEYGKITYLPLGDDDDFNWQSKTMIESEIFEIIKEKEKANELVGLILYWEETQIGVDFLAQSAHDILLSLTVNRKKIYESNSVSVTDVNWYIEKTIVNLQKVQSQVESFKFEEY